MARYYVAGPLSGKTEDEWLAHVATAMVVGRALMRKGHTPFVPHLSFWWDRYCTATASPVTYEEWMSYDREWLNQCQAFFFIASSPGASRELGWALELGLPVYTQLEDVPDAEVPNEVCSR